MPKVHNFLTKLQSSSSLKGKIKVLHKSKYRTKKERSMKMLKEDVKNNKEHWK